MTGASHHEEFACFGGACRLEITGPGPHGSARRAAAWARAQLLDWHGQFSRFLPGSELSALNGDPRETVPATPLMLELAAAVSAAGAQTDGVVDGTVVDALEQSGYTRHRTPASGPIGGVAPNPRKRPALRGARGNPMRPWESVTVDRAAGMVVRPPGIRIDSGGLVKGLLADTIVARLAGYESVLVDCAGDLALGGSSPAPRRLTVPHPFDGSTVHELEIAGGGVATSGTARRRWTGPDGEEAHHLIDPSTGRPAFTGLVQVTAVAPTALEAEILAKWALLGGPPAAPVRLIHGGVIVDQLGDVTIVAPPAPAAGGAVGPSRAARTTT